MANMFSRTFHGKKFWEEVEFWKGSPYFPVGTFPVEVHVPFTSFHKESPVSGHSGRYLCHHLKCWWLEFKRMELVSNGTSFSSMDLFMEVSESSWQMENTLFHLLVPLRNHVTFLLSHKSSRLLRRMQRWRVSWILKVWFESFFFLPTRMGFGYVSAMQLISGWPYSLPEKK